MCRTIGKISSGRRWRGTTCSETGSGGASLHCRLLVVSLPPLSAPGRGIVGSRARRCRRAPGRVAVLEDASPSAWSRTRRARGRVVEDAWPPPPSVQDAAPPSATGRERNCSGRFGEPFHEADDDFFSPVVWRVSGRIGPGNFSPRA
jgi:hypothetical protein